MSERFCNLHREREYYLNSYSLIGLKDYPKGTRITPNAAMELGQRRKVSLAARDTDEQFIPYNEQVIKELVKGYLPIVTTDILIDDALQYRTEMFAGPMQDAPLDGMETKEENYINFLQIAMTNVSSQSHTAAMRLSVTEHFSKDVPSKRPVRLIDRGTYAEGHVADKLLFILMKQEQVAVSAEGSEIVLAANLAPGETAVTDVRFAYALLDNASGALALKPDAPYYACRREVESFWQQLLDRAAQFQVPHVKAMNTLKASIVYTFMTRDRGEIHPGEGFYDLFWTRDAAFINYAIQMLNYTEEAAQSLGPFMTCTENEDGSLMSHPGQLDGTGQGLWGLYQYYMLSRDDQWLAQIYPRLKKAADWIIRTRRKDLPVSDPYYGLMPNSLADGECLWDGQYHIVGYDLWSMRGLQCFAQLAGFLGKEDDRAAYLLEFEDYKACVLRALERAGADYFPPSYEMEGTHWSNLKSVFPTPVMDPFDPRVERTMEEAEKTFVEGVCSWVGEGEVIELPMKAIHPYMSTYITQTRLIQGDHVKVADQFFRMLDHTTSTHGFPEGIFYEYRLSWNDTLPHIYGHATYIILLRRMLILEDRGALHLGLGTPDAWLADGNTCSVRNALTEFGLMSFEATTEGRVHKVFIQPPVRNQVSELYYYLPSPFIGAAVTINGERRNAVDGRKVSIPAHLCSGSIKLEAALPE